MQQLDQQLEQQEQSGAWNGHMLISGPEPSFRTALFVARPLQMSNFIGLPRNGWQFGDQAKSQLERREPQN